MITRDRIFESVVFGLQLMADRNTGFLSLPSLDETEEIKRRGHNAFMNDPFFRAATTMTVNQIMQDIDHEFSPVPEPESPVPGGNLTALNDPTIREAIEMQSPVVNTSLPEIGIEHNAFSFFNPAKTEIKLDGRCQDTRGGSICVLPSGHDGPHEHS